MCIAIAKPIGKIISDSILKTCFDNNNDGAGFACYNTDGSLFVYKTMSYTDFITKFHEMDELVRDTSPFIIHFRIRTHGTTDTFNCHPFIIDNQTAFIHNGIIRGMPDCPDKKRNDTQMFNDSILKYLPKKWWKNKAIEYLITEAIGASKLCLLNTKDSDIWIINESKGEWADGIWYSNSSYKSTRYNATPYYNQGYVKHSYCKNCFKEVTNNIYSKNIKEDFCSKVCREEYIKNKNLTESGKKKCEHCGIGTPQKWYGYKYCSYDCEKKGKEKQAKLLVQSNSSNTNSYLDIKSIVKLNKEEMYFELACIDNEDYIIDATTGCISIKCCWCGEYHDHNSINKVAFSNSNTDIDYICDECLVELKDFIKEYSVVK